MAIVVWTCFTASGPGWQNIIYGAMSFEINQQILKENVRTSKSQEKVGHAGRQQPLGTQVIPAKNSQKRINMIFGLNMSKFRLLLNRTPCRKFIWANVSEAMSKSSSKLLFKNDQDFCFYFSTSWKIGLGYTENQKLAKCSQTFSFSCKQNICRRFLTACGY